MSRESIRSPGYSVCLLEIDMRRIELEQAIVRERERPKWAVFPTGLLDMQLMLSQQ